MVGLDTGFFIACMNDDPAALSFWQNLAQSDLPPVVSLLTVGELLYIGYRINKPTVARKIVEAIYTATNVISIDPDIVEKAAALKAGKGIPYIDSLILATFLKTGCKEIHTTDKKHFSGINIKGLKLVFHHT